ILCTPVGSFASLGERIGPHLAQGCIVTDVGSVKRSVVTQLKPHMPDHVHLVPGHPIAGTEYSGPDAGFSTLFDERWCLLTPEPETDRAAVEKLTDFWKALGSWVEVMEPDHHDMVLAVTSHIPHLIAYNIVGTASELEEVTQSEVVKFSASGFRDFTRIAASDPVMWRDVFLHNKDAVIEMLGRFSEDLSRLQRAVRNGDGDLLFEHFTKTRAIRQGIIEAGQETDLPNFGRDVVADSDS
ncbi:MAG: prephenate/arogenate dehydrogenase family protein, partial [Rhizobiaceae bacterium]